MARATAYLRWANDSVRMLEHRVSAADIGRLVLSPGYERLLIATGILSDGHAKPPVGGQLGYLVWLFPR